MDKPVESNEQFRERYERLCFATMFPWEQWLHNLDRRRRGLLPLRNQ